MPITRAQANEVLAHFFDQMDARHWSMSVGEVADAANATLDHFGGRAVDDSEGA